MTKDDIFNKLKDILSKEFDLEEDSITPQAKLFDDLELDSIDAVDLMVKMKEYIPEKIDPERFKSVKTIQDVMELLYPLINKP